jgi:hypothetical protein
VRIGLARIELLVPVVHTGVVKAWDDRIDRSATLLGTCRRRRAKRRHQGCAEHAPAREPQASSLESH